MLSKYMQSLMFTKDEYIFKTGDIGTMVGFDADHGFVLQCKNVLITETYIHDVHIIGKPTKFVFAMHIALKNHHPPYS